MQRYEVQRRTTHPGVYLRLIAFPHLRLSESQAAVQACIPANVLADLCDEKIPMNRNIATQLQGALNIDAGLLMRMQSRYNATAHLG